MFHFWSSIVNQFDCLFVNFERIIFSMKKLPCYHAFLCECPKIDPDPYYHLSPLFCMFFIFSIYRFCCLHTHTYVLFAIWIVVVVVVFLMINLEFSASNTWWWLIMHLFKCQWLICLSLCCYVDLHHLYIVLYFYMKNNLC